jgi:hypothetical protein
MDDIKPCQEQRIQQAKGRRSEVVPLRPMTPHPHASRFIVGDRKYEGQYVALRSFNDRTVLASGTDRADVRQQARLAGCPSPLIQFIPKDETLGL